MITFLGIIVAIDGIAAFVFLKLKNQKGAKEWMRWFSNTHGIALLFIGVFFDAFTISFLFCR